MAQNKRYFIKLEYDGSGFFGWQIQATGRTVQAHIEESLSKLCGKPTPIVGCGRTDSGVHAKNYIAHFETDAKGYENWAYKLNKMLDDDVAINTIRPVPSELHARFSAVKRQYHYQIHGTKTVFDRRFSWHFPQIEQLDLGRIQEVNQLIMSYDKFFPFCLSNSDAKTMQCRLSKIDFSFNAQERTLKFTLESNRFLRGMVRLIVGMNINVGLHKLRLEDVKHSMEKQILLPMSYSVPAHGLCLAEITYPEEKQ